MKRILIAGAAALSLAALPALAGEGPVRQARGEAAITVASAHPAMLNSRNADGGGFLQSNQVAEGEGGGGRYAAGEGALSRVAEGEGASARYAAGEGARVYASFGDYAPSA